MFNPLEERGIPIDEQLRTWSELNVDPYGKREVDPYTRCRIIAMNGIEVESILFSHQFNRNTDILEVKEKLAQSRRVEQQQQKAINWLTPGDETTLEVTLGYEQVAVDLTAWLARSEPDPYLRQTYEFGLNLRAAALTAVREGTQRCAKRTIPGRCGSTGRARH